MKKLIKRSILGLLTMATIPSLGIAETPSVLKKMMEEPATIFDLAMYRINQRMKLAEGVLSREYKKRFEFCQARYLDKLGTIVLSCQIRFPEDGFAKKCGAMLNSLRNVFIIGENSFGPSWAARYFSHYGENKSKTAIVRPSKLMRRFVEIDKHVVYKIYALFGHQNPLKSRVVSCFWSTRNQETRTEERVE